MNPALPGNPWARSARAVRSGPAGRPALVDLVGHLRDLAVLHLVGVGERRVEIGSAFVLAGEAAGDDDLLSPVVEVRRGCLELLEILRHGAEHVLRDALRTSEGPAGGAPAARLDPLDVIFEDREDPVDVPRVE